VLSAALREVDRRRQQGFGHHLTEEEISLRSTLTSLFHGVGGVRLVTNVKNDGMPGLYPGAGGFGSWAVGRTTLSRRTLHRECALAPLVDEIPWSYTDLAQLRPVDLVAVDVYTQVTQVLSLYQTSDGACGAVLVWTAQAP